MTDRRIIVALDYPDAAAARQKEPKGPSRSRLAKRRF